MDKEFIQKCKERANRGFFGHIHPTDIVRRLIAEVERLAPIDLTTENERLKIENVQLRHTIAQLRKNRKKHGDLIINPTGEVRELYDQNISLTTKNECLSTTNKTLEEKNRRLTETNAELQERVEAIEVELSQANSLITVLKNSDAKDTYWAKEYYDRSQRLATVLDQLRAWNQKLTKQNSQLQIIVDLADQYFQALPDNNDEDLWGLAEWEELNKLEEELKEELDKHFNRQKLERQQQQQEQSAIGVEGEELSL